MKSPMGRVGSLALVTAVASSMVIACSGSEVPHGKSDDKGEGDKGEGDKGEGDKGEGDKGEGSARRSAASDSLTE